MIRIAILGAALSLGACAHKCNCADVELVETEVVEEVVEVEPEVAAEAEVVFETASEPAPETVVTETTFVGEDPALVGRRVHTRRLVEEIDAGPATAPAMSGSAADDPELSPTPKVIEEETFIVREGSQTSSTTLTTETVSAESSDVEAAEDEFMEELEETADELEDAAEELEDDVTEAMEAVENAAAE